MSLTPSKSGFTVKWDQDGEHFYETGAERAVLYPMDSTGKYGDAVAWNGLTSFEESPSGAEANPLYADDIKYLNLISKEEYAFTIGAYTYPDEFAECDGSAFLDKDFAGEFGPAIKIGQQKRKKFGFCCTTKKGNDIEQADYGYILHLIYNCTAAPSSRSHATENESPEAIEFSWECQTTPVEVTGGTPTCNLEIDMTKLTEPQRNLLEQTLFGNGTTPGKFLTPNEVVELLFQAPVEPKIVISPTAITALEVGDTATINVTEKVPAEAAVTWTSDDPDDATVDENGVVTGVAVGTAGIHATITVEGVDYTATCGVKVVAPTSEG